MATPDVTVVIPTRNRARLLLQALASVNDQTDVQFEVLIVDDGSEDETYQLLDDLSDEQIRYVHHRSAQGAPAARNAGLSLARAPWVAFLDDDDLWAPHKLAVQLDAVRHTDGLAWCQVGSVAVKADLKIFSATFPVCDRSRLQQELLRANVVPGGTSGVIVGRKIALQLGGFDTQFPACQDWDFWIRLAAAAPVMTINRPLVAKRVHRGEMSADVDRFLLGTQLLKRKYPCVFQSPTVGKDPDFQVYAGEQYLRSGRRGAAARRFVKVGLRRRNPRCLAFATAIALGFPALDWWDRRRARHIPAWWVEEADQWLGPIRNRIVGAV